MLIVRKHTTDNSTLAVYSKQFQSGDSKDLGSHKNLHDQMGLGDHRRQLVTLNM